MNMDSVSEICTNTQVLIITHASKTMPELGYKKPLLYPGAPSTDLISKVIDNVRHSLGVDNFVVTIDHKVDCPYSRAYLSNLRILCSENNINLVLSPSCLNMASQLTGTLAFNKGIQSIDQEYVLFIEHDHLFSSSVDWTLVDLAFNEGAEMLRFNRRHNVSEHEGGEIVQESSFSSSICTTNSYSNGPFLARTKYCERLFRESSYYIPSWKGVFGGFIEGPTHMRMMADEYNLSTDEFRARYPIFLYGGVGEPPIVKHFGDFPGRRSRWVQHIKQFLHRSH